MEQPLEQPLLLEAGGEAGEGETRQEKVKAVLARAKSGQDLLAKAEANISANWMGSTQPLPGNIYRVMAFGRHRGHFGECSYTGLKAVARIFGFLTVMVVQMIAPPAICMSVCTTWGIEHERRFKWENFHFSIDDWHHIALTKCLSMSFVFIFCLHSLFTVVDEIDGWDKVHAIFRYVKRLNGKTHSPGEKFLYMGAAVNLWVVFWCILDSYVVIGGSLSPKNCVMDSLGLLFLFNLDDIGGDLQFVNGASWAGDHLGWVYDNMVNECYTPEGTVLEDTEDVSCGHKVVRALQYLNAVYCGVMAVALPLLVAFTPFLKVVPH